MTRVKVCGITRPEDAMAGVEEGVDALGFVFYAKSPRYITPEKAKSIITLLPPFVVAVGVFVNETASRIHRIIRACGIHAVQLHGEESAEFCQGLETKVIKAFRVNSAAHDLSPTLAEYAVDAILLDAYVGDIPGGTGKTFPWEKAAEVKGHGPLILAGGLTPDNVGDAISCVHPYAVDVSSGVEVRLGCKDRVRIRDFVQRVRACDQHWFDRQPGDGAVT